MSAPENPPAFPSQAFGSDGLPMEAPSYGMDLRDWFAGQALSGLLSDRANIDLYSELADEFGGTSQQHVSRAAYLYADAMLAERAKGGAK